MQKKFERWWKGYGLSLTRCFTYQYVAERAYRAGYNAGRKA